ncbi:MAG: flavodoxin family protein, partial [Desulfamplus sp.]|nr:flavodoxin family protein [Desulfamplus sp.]
MFVLGLSSSPRIKGNSDYLLSMFLKQAEDRGFETATIYASKTDYEPCIGCGHCDKRGFCSIKDSFEHDIFPLFRKADLIVLATPVYFYGIPARMKVIIDRSQTLWSRKYIFKQNDPKSTHRKAVLLSVGATKGPTLFDGIRLTARYFLDALGAELVGELCYAGMDERGVLKSMMESDIKHLAESNLKPISENNVKSLAE